MSGPTRAGLPFPPFNPAPAGPEQAGRQGAGPEGAGLKAQKKKK